MLACCPLLLVNIHCVTNPNGQIVVDAKLTKSLHLKCATNILMYKTFVQTSWEIDTGFIKWILSANYPA